MKRIRHSMLLALACVLCAGATGQRPSPKYPRVPPPPPPGPDPLEDPDRSLSGDEAHRMVQLIVKALDEEEDSAERYFAAGALGMKVSHRATIPALRKLAQDSTRPQKVREGAVWGLCVTPHKDVVPVLIGLLEDEDRQIAFMAGEGLSCHFPRPAQQLGWSPPEDLFARTELAEKWRAWWAANKDEAKMNRRRALDF